MTTTLKVASFNASLNRSAEGDLIASLSDGSDSQARSIAEIVQKTDADVIVINEFDFDAAGEAAALFQSNYLSVSQNGAAPIDYPYVYVADSNTGVLSGFDLNNDGVTATEADRGAFTYANDSQGFGQFPGQFGFVIYSKHPIDEDNIRTFQNFLWKDMPDNLLTEDPTANDLAEFYSAEEIEALRLSSKNHVDLPIIVDGEIVHILAAHPTPPVFDGPEDRNGKRNHDEIRFWADYVEGAEYIYDDEGVQGGLAGGERFVIVGDYNADPFDGDSFDGAVNQLLENELILGSATDPAITPSGPGGAEQAVAQGGVNADHLGDPSFDTADFGFNSTDPSSDNPPGNLRVDYALPSADGFAYLGGEVFWPESTDPDFALTSFPTSDHRLVSVDLRLVDEDRRSVEGLEFLGAVELPSFFEFSGSTVGGLSGIVYDPTEGLYLAVSDDRGAGDDGTPRYYDLIIDLADGSLDDGDVTVTDVTYLTLDGVTLDSINPDPEGIALGQGGQIYISSERNIDGRFPEIYLVDDQGAVIGELEVDEKFLGTDEATGVRNNLGFESLTITPDQKTLFTATESALTQDGPAATVEAGSNARIVKYDLTTGEAVAEYVYQVDPIAEAPIPAEAFADSGLVELLALDDQGTLLALERSFSIGAADRGYTGKLYLVQTQAATNVIDQNPLESVENPVTKSLLVDLADLGIVVDNIEGMTLGPVLDDGRQSLIIASDDNFSAFGPQANQFIALALDLERVSAQEDLFVGVYDADSDALIAELTGGDQIPEALLEGRKVTIAARVPEDSVYAGEVTRIELNLNDGDVVRSEGVEPYALFGDRAGDFGGRSDPFELGSNQISFTLYRGAEEIAQITRAFTVGEEAPVEPVSDLEIGLYDSKTNAFITAIEDGDVIRASELGGADLEDLTILVNVAEDGAFAEAESMLLDLNDGEATRRESVEPYALFGDNPRTGDLGTGSGIGLGDNTLSLDIYAENGLNGDLLGDLEIEFTLENDLMV